MTSSSRRFIIDLTEETYATFDTFQPEWNGMDKIIVKLSIDVAGEQSYSAMSEEIRSR
jgi:hypothetical protein